MTVYTYTTFDDPLAFAGTTFAFGINDRGQIVGYYDNNSGHQGFLLSGGTYSTIDDPSADAGNTLAHAVSAIGQVVGQYTNASGTHGFFLSAGNYRTLDDPTPTTTATVPLGIDVSGQIGLIVGYFQSTSGIHGFVLNNSTYTTLDDPSASNNTVATSVNGKGQIVGHYQDAGGTIHGFLLTGGHLDPGNGNTFTGGTYTTIDHPLATSGTFLEGINDAGQIVGTCSASDGLHSFLYSGGFFTDIDDPVNDGTEAHGINNNGQIVGTLDDPAVGQHGLLITPMANPAPPAGTTADMILRASRAVSQYEIYDIGNNSLLAGYDLGQIGNNWQYAGLGRFFGSDTTDMLLRNGGTGGFEVYDISNNNITNAAFLGAVGLDWEVQGFGNFSGNPGESDMILRNTNGGVGSNVGALVVYDIRNNQITGSSSMGRVGLTWSVEGFGDFNGDGTSDMIMRNVTGALQVYDIANNQIIGSAPMGTIGREWRPSGFGHFSGNPGETDMLMRNTNTGDLELYDIANNQITGAFALGAIGLDWRFAGIAPVHAAGASDLVLRNVNTGAFEVYDIANNQLTGAASLGAVGLDWQLGGLAVDPPTGSGAFADGSSDQLVQAMAGFIDASGAADGPNIVELGADASQQWMTTPQHG